MGQALLQFAPVRAGYENHSFVRHNASTPERDEALPLRAGIRLGDASALGQF
jgi:hypothetical protein